MSGALSRFIERFMIRSAVRKRFATANTPPAQLRSQARSSRKSTLRTSVVVSIRSRKSITLCISSMARQRPEKCLASPPVWLHRISFFVRAGGSTQSGLYPFGRFCRIWYTLLYRVSILITPLMVDEYPSALFKAAILAAQGVT